MAKLNKKNLIILMILIIFIFIVPTKVNAAGSFSINKSSESLTTGATTTIVIIIKNIHSLRTFVYYFI